MLNDLNQKSNLQKKQTKPKQTENWHKTHSMSLTLENTAHSINEYNSIPTEKCIGEFRLILKVSYQMPKNLKKPTKPLKQTEVNRPQED